MYYSFKKYSIEFFSKKTEIKGTLFESYVEISLQNEYNHQITLLRRGIISTEKLIASFKEKKK